ncbi:hypothetical protein LGL55_13325 [Clostridium tagluense]|uniref:hypothetical protein n=1 Tax=Clostridium tagluense TaxID=360422 RepID=UPI001CF48CF9|nr:hypothetical protein [Clostridium tagluense]MCB2312316.1 hypothetical protein [Clostridium tagluense]MCB2316946.1 hypothetical protein [Clostridium tagluense]MCB2321855.1 hypothetical protein [Clostridium tagluense]MCB2326725.1 hypothetical protein [Clostridium tagluense]MCB2331538.1 hypothetical protein [Clostridium tagluense]
MRGKRFAPSGIILKNKIIIITLLIILIILLRFLYFYGKNKALSAIPKDGNMKFTVQFCSANLIQNNSVGNKWSYEVKINGKKVKEGRKINITATANDKISFSASAKEHDFVPDKGAGSISVNVKELKLTEKNTYLIDITVAENKGIYTGNTAIWKFNFSVIRKVSLSDIVKNIF